jgi:hypothetical protein
MWKLITCAAGFLAAPAWLPAQDNGEFPMRVRLTAQISSRANQKGDKISALVIAPKQFQGATVEGEVRQAKSSGSVKKESQLTVAFTKIAAAGREIPIQSNVTSFVNSKGQANVDEEGNVIRKSSGFGRAALWAAIGAAAGAGVGAAAGGSASAAGQGAAIGGAAGAAAALLITFGSKAPEIRFDPGSELELAVRAQR